jgi:hypothetical protein
MYSIQDLKAAQAAGHLSDQQLSVLLAFLSEHTKARPRFTGVHVLYYLGGLLALGAVSFFVTLAWSQMGDGALLVLSCALGILFFALTERMLRLNLRIPAGLLGAVALACVPLAVFAAQRLASMWTGYENYVDYHRYIDWRWLTLELSTIVAGLFLLYYWRLPFLLMPISLTLWYLGMDLVPFLMGGGESNGYFDPARKTFTLLYGLSLTLIAFWVDVRSRHSQDFAFWLYLFGVISFWGALSSMDSGSQFGKLIYCGINVLMVAIGVILSRRVFAVFGTFGIFGYLGYLSWEVFEDSLLFPLALLALGLGIIAFGVWFSKREAIMRASILKHLPGALRELIEARAV